MRKILGRLNSKIEKGSEHKIGPELFITIKTRRHKFLIFEKKELSTAKTQFFINAE